jgi:glycosyltransferase involved in cell wall biosynthesis
MSLKILLLSHSFYPQIGGIETNSEILASSFQELGHDVHVVTWTNQYGDENFSFRVIREPGVRQLFYEHKWADVVLENNPCLRLSWPRLFVKKSSVVVLNTWISKVDGSVGIQERMKHWWLKKAGNVIAVSNAVRMRCWPSAIVITNPYKENEFKKVNGLSRNRHFVFLGRLVSDKGADIAIRAIHKLSSLRNEFSLSLTVVGDGPDRKKLETLVEKLHMEDHVKFTGSLRGKELVECLNNHRFILVPSVWEEPFGNVALEGMACGCVPIVSDSGGLTDAIGKAGLSFKKGNMDSLVQVIEKLLSDERLELKLRNAANEHLAMHESKHVSRKYLQVLEAVA